MNDQSFVKELQELIQNPDKNKAEKLLRYIDSYEHYGGNQLTPYENSLYNQLSTLTFP